MSVDDLLRTAAADPDVRALGRAADQEPIDEAVLAAYYAGTLAPADRAALEARIALGRENSRALARMHRQVEHAAREPIGQRLALAAHAWWTSLPTLVPGVRLATAGAALVLVAVTLWLGLRTGRPPVELGPAFEPLARIAEPTDPSQLVGAPTDPAQLVPDSTWPLHQPARMDEAPRWLAWDPVRGATRYSLELRDPAGRLLHREDELAESFTDVPRDVRREMHSGREYRWSVIAWSAEGEPLVRGERTLRIEGDR